MDASALVAAAVARGDDDPFIGALNLASIAERVQFHLTQRDEATKFVGQIVAVDRIRSEYPPGKAKITYRPQNPGKYTADDGTETIDTDWLTDPAAAEIEVIATGGLGERCLFYKLNAADPTGDVSQGFRRVIWLTVLPSRDEDRDGPPPQRTLAPNTATTTSVGFAESPGDAASPKQVELLRELCAELCYSQDKGKWLAACGLEAAKVSDLSKQDASNFIDYLTGLKRGDEDPPPGWMKTNAGQYMVEPSDLPF